MRRFLVAALALSALTLSVRAADVENPYKNAKVGDYATYTMTTKVANFNVDGTLTQTVTAKTDKEVTIKGAGFFEIMGKKVDLPGQEQKIDLTKPFDPTKTGNLPGGGMAKVEKGKEGKEKLKVGGKEYNCTWTSYTVKAKAMGMEVESVVKVWMSKDVPMGMVKMTMTGEVAGQKTDVTMELKEFGNKK